MSGIARPELRHAARAWLDSDAARHPEAVNLRSALVDFLGDRYVGAAEQLKSVHAKRRSFFGDRRRVASLSDRDDTAGDDGTLDAAASASAPVEQGRLLFQLVRAFRPERTLELGTNIGISAAYLAVGLRHGGGGKLTTVEGSGSRLAIAEEVLADLGVEGVDVVEGRFDDVLPGLLPSLAPIGAAFLDGNHRRDATLRYFEILRHHMPSGSLIILDDIRWSEEMLEAWETVKTSSEVTVVADLGRTGLVTLT